MRFPIGIPRLALTVDLVAMSRLVTDQEPTRPRVWRTFPEHIRKFPRSLVPRPTKDNRSNLYIAATRWLAPWDSRDYPGHMAACVEASGAPWDTCRGYQRGTRRLAGAVATRLADLIEARCNAGLSIVRELREYAQSYRHGNAERRGFCEVKERDGVATDGRPKRTRKGW